MPTTPNQRFVAVYPIGMVERLTSLTRRQIRYYEDRGLLQPKRTTGNHRLYSPDDVQRLQAIRDYLSQGYSLEGIKNLLEERDAEEARRLERGSIPGLPGVPFEDARTYFNRTRVLGRPAVGSKPGQRGRL